MIQVRPFGSLGGFRNEWLNAKHHFSFGSYHDPKRMGFGRLRVWNDDEIAPGTGFDPHPHREMEIITYIRHGAITHRDNLGNEGRTAAGDVQVMHAGTGIVHAEYNSENAPTRLFQIWIQPDKNGATPGWATRQFPREGGLAVLASGRAQDADSDALPLNADAACWPARCTRAKPRRWAHGGTRHLPGSRDRVGGRQRHAVGARDGAAISGETELTITAKEASELVLVDVAA